MFCQSERSSDYRAAFNGKLKILRLWTEYRATRLVNCGLLLLRQSVCLKSDGVTISAVYDELLRLLLIRQATVNSANIRQATVFAVSVYYMCNALGWVLQPSFSYYLTNCSVKYQPCQKGWILCPGTYKFTSAQFRVLNTTLEAQI